MFVWAIVSVAASAALCFMSYLVFLAFVIVRTGDTKGLHDVAEAIRAFNRPSGSRRSASRVPDDHADTSVAPAVVQSPLSERQLVATGDSEGVRPSAA